MSPPGAFCKLSGRIHRGVDPPTHSARDALEGDEDLAVGEAVAGLCRTGASAVASAPVRPRRVRSRGAPRYKPRGVVVIPTDASRIASNAAG